MELRSWLMTVVSLGSVGLLGAAVLPACSSQESGPSVAGVSASATDSGGPAPDAKAPSCAPGSRTCKSDTVAQACSADGSAQTEQPCGAGERCAGGNCVSGTNPNVCQDATTALRRLPTGAFEVVKCPAGTACTGPGLCQGAFVVGSAECSSLQVVATSVDGRTQVATTCPAGQLCVATGDNAGVATAACKPSECVPSMPNLAFCGNPKSPTTNVGKIVTKCVSTPAGYTYVSSLCAGASTCIPGTKASNNNNNKPPTDAGCASACVAGSSRCVGSGVSTCLADGTWSAAVVPCSPSQACMASPSDPSKSICGDVACARSQGACDGASFRACSATATLGAAAACASGTCVADGFGGGLCAVECAAGEERCVRSGSTSYQTCTNGRWSATATSCPGAAACATFTDGAGKSAKVCGADCAPGTMRCSLEDGGPAGTEATQTCSAAGHWGAATACAVGSCQTNGSVAACVAECVPGTMVCAGDGASLPGMPYAASTGFRTCTVKGVLAPTVTTCAGDTFCRTKGGRAIAPAGATSACLTCIGSNVPAGNEDGLVDSRCSAPGDGGSDSAQVCAADDTWTASNLTTCANGCTAPTPRQGPAAPFCQLTGRGEPRTETYYSSRRRGSCINSNQHSLPARCGATPDCCDRSCQRPIAATPASCNAAAN
ncbi:MAG TPA: hypothetical protein VLT33_50175 [Labilithrix sp.]|nr:hypothetical protein [Labilithrix sp.]